MSEAGSAAQFDDDEDPEYLARQARVKTDKEYAKHYKRGVAASKRYTGSSRVSPLERADQRGEPDAWYDGYSDHASR